MNLTNGLGWPHLLIIAGVIVLLFGSRKLPEMARSLGKSARILRAETKGMRADEATEEQQALPAGSSGSAESQSRRSEIERLREQLEAAQLREKLAAAEARATAAEQHPPNADVTTSSN